MKKNKKDRLLTEVELELMNIIWRIEKCSVRDVMDALPAGRDVTYTTVAKMMKILEDKGVLKSEKGEKTHLYESRLAREDYETRTLRHLTDKLFEGSPKSMVMRLLDESELTREELEAIRTNLEARLKG